MNNTIFPVAVLAAMLSVAMPKPLMLPSTAALEQPSCQAHPSFTYQQAAVARRAQRW